MKKILFALALVATLGMVGCSKDEETETKNDNQQKSIDWGIAEDLYGKTKTEAQGILAQAGYDSVGYKMGVFYYQIPETDDTIFFECSYEDQKLIDVVHKYYVEGDVVKSFFATKLQQGLDSIYVYKNNNYSFTSFTYCLDSYNNSEQYSEFKNYANGTENLSDLWAQWVGENMSIELHALRYGDNAQNYRTRIGVSFIDASYD